MVERNIVCYIHRFSYVPPGFFGAFGSLGGPTEEFPKRFHWCRSYLVHECMPSNWPLHTLCAALRIQCFINRSWCFSIWCFIMRIIILVVWIFIYFQMGSQRHDHDEYFHLGSFEGINFSNGEHDSDFDWVDNHEPNDNQRGV